MLLLLPPACTMDVEQGHVFPRQRKAFVSSFAAPKPCDVSCRLHQACGFDFDALGGDLEGARTAAEGALRDAGASPAAVASVASECYPSVTTVVSMAACQLSGKPGMARASSDPQSALA